jgi:hypothetical protein
MYKKMVDILEYFLISNLTAVYNDYTQMCEGVRMSKESQ